MKKTKKSSVCFSALQFLSSQENLLLSPFPFLVSEIPF